VQAPAGDSRPSIDIAHKPNKTGWGYTKQYADNWDRIFGKKKKQESSEASTFGSLSKQMLVGKPIQTKSPGAQRAQEVGLYQSPVISA
jgi:hypothetical protein